MSLKLSIAIILLFPALGVLVDLLLLNREKPIIYERLFSLGEKIHHTKLPDIYKLMIRKSLSVFHQILDFKKRPVWSGILTLLISWGITSCMSLVFNLSPFMDDYPEVPAWYDHLPWYPVYLVNMPFDILTVFITIFILKKIQPLGWIRSVQYIFLDIILAFIFANLSFGLMAHVESELHISEGWGYKYTNTNFNWANYQYNDSLSLEDYLDTMSIPSSRKNWLFKKGFSDSAKIQLERDHRYLLSSLKTFPKSIGRLVTGRRDSIISHERFIITEKGKNTTIEVGYKNLVSPRKLFLSITTFFPTALYLLILLILIISKEFMVLSKWLSIRFLESSLEKRKEDDFSNFKPGAHFGAVFGLLVAILRIFSELLG